MGITALCKVSPKCVTRHIILPIFLKQMSGKLGQEELSKKKREGGIERSNREKGAVENRQRGQITQGGRGNCTRRIPINQISRAYVPG